MNLPEECGSKESRVDFVERSVLATVPVLVLLFLVGTRVA
jgi:hypothetical protein